jgi:hypothetical protein
VTRPLVSTSADVNLRAAADIPCSGIVKLLAGGGSRQCARFAARTARRRRRRNGQGANPWRSLKRRAAYAPYPAQVHLSGLSNGSQLSSMFTSDPSTLGVFTHIWSSTELMQAALKQSKDQSEFPETSVEL